MGWDQFGKVVGFWVCVIVALAFGAGIAVKAVVG